jgi:hypothetical protein
LFCFVLFFCSVSVLLLSVYCGPGLTFMYVRQQVVQLHGILPLDQNNAVPVLLHQYEFSCTDSTPTFTINSY